MQSPAAMFIESAQDTLKDVPEWIKKSQRKELEAAVPQVSDDFAKGYELGLQTARAVIAGSVALSLAGVKSSDVL